MARPTKIEIENREKIKELNIFVRDSEIYTNFGHSSLDEDACGTNKSKYSISYRFCLACATRDVDDDIKYEEDNYDKFNNKTISYYSLYEEYTPKEKLKILSSLNYSAYVRMFRLYVAQFFYPSIDDEEYYQTLNLVNYNDLVTALERDHSLSSYCTHTKNIPFPVISNHTLQHHDVENLKKAKLNFLTIIKRVGLPHNHNEKNRLTYVELDFTKSNEELLAFVSRLKDDFNDNPQTISNLNDVLGDNDDLFICDLENCDIFKSNNIKPITGRLADVLFIYDCKKAGLENEFILKEINKYWTETKNLFKDELQIKTLREYHNIAIEYIDNKKYTCYLSGYNSSSK